MQHLHPPLPLFSPSLSLFLSFKYNTVRLNVYTSLPVNIFMFSTNSERRSLLGNSNCKMHNILGHSVKTAWQIFAPEKVTACCWKYMKQEPLRGLNTWNQFCMIMDLSKYGYWEVEMIFCLFVCCCLFVCQGMKERLHSSFFLEWRYHLESSDRLSLYSLYKNCFKRGKHIDVLWLDLYRNGLA